MKLGILDQLAHITVRIECTDVNGNISSGTGFFFGFLNKGDRQIPAVVTNKHVIKDAVKGSFNLTIKGDDDMPLMGQHKKIEFDNFESRFIPHPEENVDLAIFLAGPILNAAAQQGLDFYYTTLNQEIIPTEEFYEQMTPIEDILMFGYPNGIWDSTHNLPLVRKGITSTHPKYDFNGKPEFLIDAACFHGSSGSPVFLVNNGISIGNQGSTHLGGGLRLKLLGVLWGGPQYTTEGGIHVVPIPTSKRAISVTSTLMNLGYVIQARKIKDFETILKESDAILEEFQLS